MPCFQGMAIDHITPDMGEAFKQERMIVSSRGNAKKEWRTLQSMLNRAVEWKDITINPLHGLRNIKTPPPRIVGCRRR
jgi:hypothetical protein